MSNRQQSDKAASFYFYWRVYAPLNAPSPTPEYPFSQPLGRKHRFDYAFISKKLAVEVEGNAAWVKGGGKHMQDRDLEKYNIAAMLGWRVLRFSPAMLEKDPAGCIKIVMQTLEAAG